MTDNERRAHDLAVSATQNLERMKLDDFENNSKNHPFDNKEFTFDTYAEYIKAYNAFLERFNEEVTDKS